MHGLSTQLPRLCITHWKRLVLQNRKGLACKTCIRPLFIHDMWIHGHSLWCLYQLLPACKINLSLVYFRASVVVASVNLLCALVRLWLPSPTPSFSSHTAVLQRYEELSQTASDQALRSFLQTFKENHPQVSRLRPCWHDVIIHLMTSYVSLYDVMMMSLGSCVYVDTTYHLCSTRFVPGSHAPLSKKQLCAPDRLVL